MAERRQWIAWSVQGNVEAQVAVVADGIDQCWLFADEQSALVFLKGDGVMPLAWVIFSTKEPYDVLLVAVARTLIAHRSACVEGRDFL